MKKEEFLTKSWALRSNAIAAATEGGNILIHSFRGN